MPAFLLYIVIIKPVIFKSVKAVFLRILFFIIPLFLYAFIPKRSLQGYGPATTLQKFIYHITGRKSTGEFHGGFYQKNSLHNILKVVYDFLLIIYRNFGIFLLVIAAVGFIYLIRKNIKFVLTSILAIILSIAITSQYLGWVPENYALDSMLIITFYISAGFLFIYDILIIAFNKSQKKISLKPESKILPLADVKKSTFFKFCLLTLLFLIVFSQPVLFAANNYKKVDLSKPEGVYLFWDNGFKAMEPGSIAYLNVTSENIAEFINLYEQQDKKIILVAQKDKDYTLESIIEGLTKGKTVYLVGNISFLKKYFNLEQKGEQYFWKQYNENLALFKVTIVVK